MAIKKLADFTTSENFTGREQARVFLGYRKMMEHPLLNLIPFSEPRDLDPGATKGSRLVNMAYLDDVKDIQARDIGKEPVAKNISRKTDTIEMTILTDAYEIDRQQLLIPEERAEVIGDNVLASTEVVGRAIVQAFLSAKKGEIVNSTVNTTTWKHDGLHEYFKPGKALADMTDDTPVDFTSGMGSTADAKKFFEVIAGMKNKVSKGVVAPTDLVWVATPGVVNLIDAYNFWLGVNSNTIQFGAGVYKTLMNSPVVQVENSEVPSDVSAIGESLVLARVGKNKRSLSIIHPYAQILDILTPSLPNSADALNGDSRVYGGSVETIGALAVGATDSAARAFFTLE
jgi:hypothetical protein